MATVKILVVEDDSGIRNLVFRFFQQKGYEVQAAKDGKTALAVFEQFNPDLAFFRKKPHAVFDNKKEIRTYRI